MRRPRSSRRRGNTIVLATVLLSALFAMVAFAIDLGYVAHARTELQRTADACALGACHKLPDKQAALAFAQAIAADNLTSTSAEISGEDLEIGYWQWYTATFTSPPPFGRSANAVRVSLRRTRATGNPLGLFFANVMATSQADASVSATAVFDRGLCGPFVGIDWLDVPGGPQTDSYDTFEGLYNSSLARDRGGICSDGPIAVDGNPVVRGDARAGKGYDVTISGGPTITGNIGSRLKPLTMPPVDLGDVKLKNDNSNAPLIPEGNSWKSPIDENGNFLLDGNKTYTIPPGTYCFNDFTLAGQAQLNITNGPVIIYVTGDLSRAGGTQVNNLTKIPNNLQIYMTGGTATITSGNAFHGVIYAPHTPITLDGGSDFFGACVGKTLTVTGDAFGHYDESLDLEGVELSKRVTLVD